MIPVAQAGIAAGRWALGQGAKGLLRKGVVAVNAVGAGLLAKDLYDGLQGTDAAAAAEAMAAPEEGAAAPPPAPPPTLDVQRLPNGSLRVTVDMDGENAIGAKNQLEAFGQGVPIQARNGKRYMTYTLTEREFQRLNAGGL